MLRCHSLHMPSESRSTSDAEAQARAEYAFAPHAPLSRAQSDHVCQAALDVLRSALGFVVVDAFTDYEEEITKDVRAAQTGLRELAAEQHPRRRQPGMGIEVDPRDDEQWALLRTYAAWSINVDLWASKYEEDLGTLHDCAHGIGVTLGPDELATLTDATVALGTWVPMTEILTADREAKDRRRADRRQQWATRLRRIWPC